MIPGTKIDVELCGGPLDGHRAEVTLNKPGFDVLLFKRQDAVPSAVYAYAMAGRTCDSGRRWVLNFLYEVAKCGGRKEGGEG